MLPIERFRAHASGVLSRFVVYLFFVSCIQVKSNLSILSNFPKLSVEESVSFIGTIYFVRFRMFQCQPNDLNPETWIYQVVLFVILFLRVSGLRFFIRSKVIQCVLSIYLNFIVL